TWHLLTSQKAENGEKTVPHRERRRRPGAVAQAAGSGAAPGRVRRLDDLARGSRPNHRAQSSTGKNPQRHLVRESLKSGVDAGTSVHERDDRRKAQSAAAE